MQRLFVDNINVFSLIQVLLHWSILWLMISGKRILIYYFAISPSAEVSLHRLARVLPLRGEKADYSAAEVIGDDSSSWYRTEREDLRELCDEIRGDELKDHPLVQKMGRRFDQAGVLVYLEKWLARDLEPIMRHVQVIGWYRRVWNLDLGTQTVFFIAGSPWHRYLEAYAKRSGIRIVRYLPVSGRLRQVAGQLIRVLINRVKFRRSPRTEPKEKRAQKIDVNAQVSTRMAVSFIGKGLTLDPVRNSDLFMLPHIEAKPGQVLLYLWRGDNPLDQAKRDWLDQAGIKCVALNHKAGACAGVPVWQFKFDQEILDLYINLAWWWFYTTPLFFWRNLALRFWLMRKMVLFIGQYAYWRAFYRAFNIRMHITYMDWNADRIAGDLALADLGGISVSYQVSATALFAPVIMASVVDVHFVFALPAAQIRMRSGSCIGQYVAVGYNNDNSFRLVRERALALRSHLQGHGARFIICFFDENSVDDRRIIWTHEHMAVDYIFLLRSLMDDPTLGLIFKPKKPNTLHARLGPAAELLDKTLATGRCFIFSESEGQLVTDALPNEAGQAADVAIGILHGITAAAESALAGTPTLLIDRFHMRRHPYYQWGRGKVVFDNWDELFTAMMAYRKDAASVPGFGDWTPVMNQLDPFRDGRAAERMGTYIRWLAEGMDKGLSRDETLEQARERYVALWGDDKVLDCRHSATKMMA